MQRNLTKTILLFLIAIGSANLSFGQFNTVNYVSYGYFTGLNLADSMIVSDTTIITIDQNKVTIVDINPLDKNKDQVLFESRSMSALKYPASSGEYYYVWKLGDRKMILRVRNGVKYLSLYQTDEYGLPKEYLTFKIKG